jgi:hypothetical protein
MKKTIAALVIACVVHLPEVRAINISHFFLTETSVSFDISGTLPAPFLNNLNFVNPTVSANPGFALGSFFKASSYSFVGTSYLAEYPLWNAEAIQTGNASWGDYFFVSFRNSQDLLGTITANWSSVAFNPSQVTSLDVYWSDSGSLDPSSITKGTYLTSVQIVPEPSTTTTLLLAGAMMVALHLLRTRRKSGKQRPLRFEVNLS